MHGLGTFAFGNLERSFRSLIKSVKLISIHIDIIVKFYAMSIKQLISIVLVG